MKTIMILLPAIPAAFLIAEDFRSREVRLLWLIALCVITLSTSFVHEGAVTVMSNVFFNVIFLLYLGIGALIWVKIRFRRTGRRFSDYLGWGDIIFLLALTPLFGLREFLVFLLLAMTFSVVWWIITRYCKRLDTTIPLVGTSGVLFCVHLIISAL